MDADLKNMDAIVDAMLEGLIHMLSIMSGGIGYSH